MPSTKSLSSKAPGQNRKNNFSTPLGKGTKNKPSAGQNLPSVHSTPLKRFRGMTSQGAKIMGLGAKTQQASGPGEPPEGFVGGTTSKSEWYLYWALTKVLGPEEEGDWSYQNSMLGGRSTKGGAVVDFVIDMNPIFLGIRLQTHQFHLFDTGYQKTSDREQLIALSDWDFIVIDVYENQFIEDETGASAIQVVLACLRQEFRPDPLGVGFIV